MKLSGSFNIISHHESFQYKNKINSAQKSNLDLLTTKGNLFITFYSINFQDYKQVGADLPETSLS